MIKTINSLTNPAIKKVVTLHTAKGRSLHQEYIVEGLRSLTSYAHTGLLPIELYCVEDMIPHTQELFKKTVTTVVPPHVMAKLSTSQNPAGMLAVFVLPPLPKPERLTSGIVLAQIQDPGNMGTLIRSAVGLGYKSVVIIEGCDPYSPKVIQATAGTLPHAQVFTWSWQELIKHKKNLKLCALVLDDTKHASTYPASTTLFVVGNEAQGLPQAWIDECDITMTIPISPQAESLNAAVAGSIALYRGLIDKIS